MIIIKRTRWFNMLMLAVFITVLAGCKTMDGGWEIDSPFIDIEYTPKEVK